MPISANPNQAPALLKNFFFNKIFYYYLATFLLGFCAKRNFVWMDFTFTFEFLWIVYLPFATAATVSTFDFLMDTIDFEDLKDIKDNHKYQYSISLAILSAGFAIASAIFLK